MRIIDSHTHSDNGRPEMMIEMADHFHYEKLCVLGIPCSRRRLNNLECLLAKKANPERVYVYGGMMYADTLPVSAKMHEKQLELMMDVGFDGWKILESKSSYYKRLQIPLDGEAFEGAFALAEKENIPITWHAGDPATFYSEKTAPQFAIDNHWLCVGEGFPPLSTIYREVETVLERHPRLRATMAHLYFTSDDRAHAERLLNKYESLRFDITPGSEMYTAFLSDRDGWRRFFETYKDQLIFGTDMVDGYDDVVFGSQDVIVDFVMKTLISDKPFNVKGIAGTGLGLDESILKPLMAENFEAIVGPKPRPISKSGLNAYGEWMMPYLTKEERTQAEGMLSRMA